MKFQVIFKTPDAVRDTTREPAYKDTQTMENYNELSREEREDAFHVNWDRIIKDTKKWVRYGEYITVEFDTTQGTAIVLPMGDK